MTTPCRTPLLPETLAEYWAGELPPAEEDAVEEHLFGCAECTGASARVAAITETLRSMLPPVISAATLERLRGKGMRVLENPMLPGERKAARFPADVDLLIHRLGGLDLSHATRVDFEILDDVSGQSLNALADAPFDRQTGSVLVACLPHFAGMPHDTLIEIRTHDDSGVEAVTSYTVLHDFEPRRGAR